MKKYKNGTVIKYFCIKKLFRLCEKHSVEAVVRGLSSKLVFLKILQILQEITRAGVSL